MSKPNNATEVNFSTTSYKCSKGYSTFTDMAERYTVTEISGHLHVSERVPSCGIEVYMGTITAVNA